MASGRAAPPVLKSLNERTVLDAMRSYAPVSRAEISRRVGISKPTVSQVLQSLLRAGLVRETEPDGDGPRYGAVFFEPDPGAAFVLGVDLGARFVRAAVCDLAGEVRGRRDVDLPEPTSEAALATIPPLVLSLLRDADVAMELLDGVVLGVPGAVEGDGRINLVENVAGLQGEGFASELRSRFECSVHLENDINLAALGERSRGVARGVDDFAFISIG